MEKRLFGKTGLMVTPVIYGGVVSMDDGQEKSDQYVRYAIEKGINYFDIAPTYGDAQEKLGNSLKPYRKDVYLACKTGKRLVKEAQAQMEESLRMLYTDYFDVYQLHALMSVEDTEQAFSSGGVMEVILKAKEKGIIRFVGITCHNEEAALRALELYDFDTVMFPTNWNMHLGKGFGARLCALKKEKNFGLVGMKSLIYRAWKDDGERDTSGFPKSWCKPIAGDDDFAVRAMKYGLSMGADTLVPPGNFYHFSFAVEHIDECLKNPLSDADVEILKGEVAKLNGGFFL